MHNYYSHILKVPFENSPGSGIVYIWIGRFVSQLLITLFFPFSLFLFISLSPYLPSLLPLPFTITVRLLQRSLYMRSRWEGQCLRWVSRFESWWQGFWIFCLWIFVVKLFKCCHQRRGRTREFLLGSTRRESRLQQSIIFIFIPAPFTVSFAVFSPPLSLSFSLFLFSKPIIWRPKGCFVVLMKKVSFSSLRKHQISVKSGKHVVILNFF